MRKYLLTFLVLFVQFFGCSNNPLNDNSQKNILIDFQFLNKPFPFPASQLNREVNSFKLLKPHKIIETRVLSLDCDGTDPNLEKDSTPYQNHAALINVTRTTSDNGTSLSFDGRNSYCVINHSDELNGTMGFHCQVDIVFKTISASTQTIISKSGVEGGYILAAQNGNIYLIIKNTVEEIILRGTVQLTPNQLYHIEAGFYGEQLFLNINDRVDGTLKYAGTVPNNFSPVIVGATQTAHSFSDFLDGELDNIVFQTKLDILEFDVIRVAIMDFTNFDLADSLERDSKYAGFDSTRFQFLYGQREVTWSGLAKVLGTYFQIINTQNLPINNGIAQGTIVGTEGINLVSAAAIKDESIQYYGESFVLTKKDRVTELDINLYKVHY